MSRFLFVFGFESPAEWVTNERSGTDFESSEAVWIRADSEQQALELGRRFAARETEQLFHSHPELHYPGWLACGYSHWIEALPSSRFSPADVASLAEISSDSL